MKSLKFFLCLLAFSSLTSSYLPEKNIKPKVFCGPQFQIENWGATNIEFMHIYNSIGSDVVYEDFPPNTTSPLHTWPQDQITVKLILATAQNGSIKIYKNGNLIDCIPTSSSQDTRYEFGIDGDCFSFYRIVITTDPC